MIRHLEPAILRVPFASGSVLASSGHLEARLEAVSLEIFTRVMSK